MALIEVKNAIKTYQMGDEQKQERGYYQKKVLNSAKNDVQSLKASLDRLNGIADFKDS